jgi:transposase
MEIVHTHCAGLDVQKKTVVAAIIVPGPKRSGSQETRTFGTMTADLLALSDWLTAHGVTHVAMERTGEYWKPVFNLLESDVHVVWVKAQHIKAVPGRQTAVNDADWIADLVQHGVLRASVVPPLGHRERRDLTRHRRNVVRERASLVTRVQKVLESAHITLASVATDVRGVSGRAMLAALTAGQASPTELAELAKGRLREQREPLANALEGRVQAHHRLVLTARLCQIDNLDDTMARFDAQIEAYCAPFEEAVVWLDPMPGVARQTAESMVAEMGTDMSRFPTADHLAAWAGVAPGNHESAGKRRSSQTRQGNRPLGVAWNQAAHAAARTQHPYLAAPYHRLAGRRGKKKAMVAVAHAMVVIAYHLMQRNEPYRELGGDYFDKQRPDATAKRLVTRLERLGSSVTLQQKPMPGVA